VVPSSLSIAYPWVGRIIVAGLPCLVAPRSTCLPFSYVNCIVTQKYYKCAIMSRKKLCQTRSTPTLRHKGRFPYELIISSCPVYTFPDTRDSAWNMVRANCTWAIGRKVGSYLRLRRLSGFVLQDIIGLIIGRDTFAPEEKIPLHRKRYLCTGRKDTFAPGSRQCIDSQRIYRLRRCFQLRRALPLSGMSWQ